MNTILFTAVALCAGIASADVLPLIPVPVSLKVGDGNFEFTATTGIRFGATLEQDAKLFAADLEKLTGQRPITVRNELRTTLPSEIRIEVDGTIDEPPSGYHLSVSPKGIAIVGKDAAGAYYGTRTLLQMLPAGRLAHGGKAQIPAVTIADHPRFVWRGVLLDVGRYFYPPSDIKRLIDWLAFHKLNVFHWHLTEDQGWRVEIKKYPKLTEVGAWRESSPPYGERKGSDGMRHGGFYTQDEVREIVAYAAARHVTIVPEIDMPGHMMAAIASYPELGNNDIPGYDPKVATHWGVHPYTLAPTESTFRFVDDVFTEICALFPSTYIHMGGDEAPKTQWEASPRVRELMEKEGLKTGHDVQSYFVKRVEKILESKGRKLIGWDEIREGGLSPRATVMSWRSEEGGIASAKEGHDVVMATNQSLYLDYYQAPAADELAKGAEYECIGGFLPLSKVYSYNPVPKALTSEEARHVLGVQGQLWSEYARTFKKVEYLAFPRIAALAEIAWSPHESKDYDQFTARLRGITRFYDAAGLNRGEIPASPANSNPKLKCFAMRSTGGSLGCRTLEWTAGIPNFHLVTQRVRENIINLDGNPILRS